MKKLYPVLNGAESFYIEGGKVGILLSHGFMGTPQSVWYLGEKLSQLGYTVFAPRLRGHGTHAQDLENATHHDWMFDLEAGYQYLKERCTIIFVMGQSMGGALALWQAHKNPDINGVITINAALSIPDYEYLAGKTSPRFLPEGSPDIRKEGVHEITYDKVPLRAIHEIQVLMKKTPEIIPTITQPVLAFKSIVDHVVPPENTDYIIKQVASVQKEAVTLYHSYHVASMDHDRDEIVEKTHDFIQVVIAKTAQNMVYS
jgi:carboxylesterase